MTKNTQGISRSWLEVFMTSLRNADTGAPLKEAASQGRLGPWTKSLTAAVVATFPALGWVGVAKGHRSTFLPVSREEYLGLDVVAFEAAPEPRWRFPAAVFELENSRVDASVAYSLWKVLNVRARLRAVFCYRPDFPAGVSLVERLTAEVIAPLAAVERMSLGGETLLVVGTRSSGGTFPYGFFKSWALDANMGQFQPI